MTTAVRSRTSSWLWVVRVSVNTGTKAWLNAPSAKIRRPRLGSIKAMKKASSSGPAPKARARVISRTRPSTRDESVRALTTLVDLSRDRDMRAAVDAGAAARGD